MNPREPHDSGGASGDVPDALASFGFGDESWLGRLRSAAAPGDAPLGTLETYELLGQIGQGGQATVYKARQPGTGRVVAIKRVRLAGLDDRALARFQREIEVAATLRHPGIVTVHELIDQGRGLVMEWVEGVPLDRWADGVRGSPDGLRQIVACVKAVCEAVAHAHGAGVIHRDLKPTNILVESAGEAAAGSSPGAAQANPAPSRSDGVPTPKVLDFGLARDLTKQEATFTVQGAFAGTPVYAAPEQIDLGLHAADVRADVYAMGVVLYRALTGHEPFESPTLAGLFDLIRRAKADPPSDRNPGIDDELQSIVQMAMRPDRATRYATMADLAEDLCRWMDRKAVRAHPLSTMYLARTFVRRHRLGVGLAALAFALIAGAAVTASVLAWRLSERNTDLKQTISERDAALTDATQQRDLARAEERTAISINHFLTSLMMSVGDRAPEAKAAVLGVFQDKVKQLDAPNPMRLRPEFETRQRLTLGRTLRALGDLSGAQAQGEKVLALIEKYRLPAGDREQAAGLIRAVLMERGDFAAVIAEHEIAQGQPGRNGAYVPHALVTSDDTYIEALVRSGQRERAQRFLDTMTSPEGVPVESLRMILGPFRALCEKSDLRPPAWMTPPAATPGNPSAAPPAQ